MGAASYQPRAMEGTVLHRVVREHFETFRAEIAAHTDGGGLPRFVEREFREFLTCGVLSRGFARVRWDSGPACAGAGPSRRSRLRRVLTTLSLSVEVTQSASCTESSPP